MSTENTSSEFTSSPASWEETAPQEGAPSQSAENDSAAGEALVVAQADGEDISPVDAEDAAATDQPAAEGEEGSQQTVFTANDQNQVVLPANVSLDNAIIEGANLVFIQPDGTEITIENAALNVPTFLIDGVEIPQETLVAALQESGINVAAGPGGTLVATSTPRQLRRRFRCRQREPRRRRPHPRPPGPHGPAVPRAHGRGTGNGLSA
ncbi:hypothetical protein QW131_28475 [Roseibium salinum]|nr:hypothetical protein [Roseibium salinum]